MVDRGKIRCFNCNEMGHFATECKKPRQFKNTSYDVSQKKKTDKAYLAEGKSWDDSESEDEEVGNLALMAISDNPLSSKPQVTFTDTEMIYHLSSTLDCARRDNDRIILQNNALNALLRYAIYLSGILPLPRMSIKSLKVDVSLTKATIKLIRNKLTTPICASV